MIPAPGRQVWPSMSQVPPPPPYREYPAAIWPGTAIGSMPDPYGPPAPWQNPWPNPGPSGYAPRPSHWGGRVFMDLRGISSRLIQETDAFLAVWSPTARLVPQGDDMLEDAVRLYDAAVAFDQGLNRGLDPDRLARLARDIERHSSRLVRRVDRVARGRIGPNIEQVYKIGSLASELANGARVFTGSGYRPMSPFPGGFR